jgi:MFS family permease
MSPSGAIVSADVAGPLEQTYRARSAAFHDASNGSRVTGTHWHIAIAAFVIAEWGWRVACVVPAVVALLAVYVRMGLPESPYWVRLQDRKPRIRETQAAGRALLPEDQAWLDKAAKIPLRQLFLPDMLRSTAAATFIACCSTIIYGTVGGWMPLYLAQERHWPPRPTARSTSGGG